MVEVQHVTKRYGSFTAVDDISFSVERGEILGFLGPNGAGKTTTMRILTGFLPATDGRARVAGFDVFEQPLEAKRRTGYLPETPPLYPEMTVHEYLRFVARINGMPAGDRDRQIASAMVRTSVADVANRFCGTLSKGYRQRVGLAQAILHNPDVLVLDEPTAGLDPKQQKQTRQLIKELAGDHTIILSTHILSEVEATCQKVTVIHGGELRSPVESKEAFKARLGGGQQVNLQIDTLGADPIPALKQCVGVISVTLTEQGENVADYRIESGRGDDVRRDLSRVVVENGWGLLELKAQEVNLEDVFLQLTTEEESANAEQTSTTSDVDLAGTERVAEDAVDG